MEMQTEEWSHDANTVDGASIDPDNLFHNSSPSLDDFYGTPEVNPRVGKEYQADILTLETERDYLQSRQTWSSRENRSDVDDFLCMRLSVPLIWACDKIDYSSSAQSIYAERCLHYKNSKKFKDQIKGSPTLNGISCNGPYVFSDLKACATNIGTSFMRENTELKAESLDHCPSSSSQDPSSHAVKSPFQQIDNPIMCKQYTSFGEKSEDKHFDNLNSVDLGSWHLVPGALNETWSELEQESFLLGLYIFGKNLVQVKKFVESKGMGDILSFYYGSFFRSDSHQRWSECRKIRSKRSIHGHRIFHGLRQQELLSRLTSHMSEESKSNLLENTRAYNEGKVSLEEYVTMLKMSVGLATLVEAVGIGKGKYDLTGINAEPARNYPTVSRAEIPVGKACSSLTLDEIIKFLTGDFRLSKARSNDLFWEAVWPRLLASGWHSEQPKNHGYVGPKNSLVFLIPGVKKFSRRKLVKGVHYFDSLSDVLNKVAMDPSLLEFETHVTKSSRIKEEIWDANAKDEKGVSDHHRHCYLRPKGSLFVPEDVKFTVVDTSMVYEEPYRVRDMRALPVESGSHSPASFSSDIHDESSDELVDGSESAGTSPNASSDSPAKRNENLGKGINVGTQPDHQNGQVAMYGQTSPKDEVGVARVCTDNLEKGPTPFTSKRKDHESYHMTDSCTGRYLAPVSKRQRIDPGNHGRNHQEDEVVTAGFKVKEELPSEPSKVNVPKTSAVDDSRETRAPNASFDGGQVMAVGDICMDEKRFQEKGIFHCHDESFPRRLIDLNLPFPHCTPDVEMDDAFDTQVVHCRDNPDPKGDSVPLEISQQTESAQPFESSDGAVNAKDSTAHARRQSTRKRDLTLRALEALQCGLMSTRHRARGTKSSGMENLASKSRRRKKRDIEVIEQATSIASGNDTGASMNYDEEKVDEEGTTSKIKNEFHSDEGATLRLSKSLFQPEISTAKDSRSG